MNLVSLARYRNRELVAVLKELTQLAETGHIHGIAFVAKMGRCSHRPGLAGDYRRNPDEALSAAVRLKQQLLADDESDESSGT